MTTEQFKILIPDYILGKLTPEQDEAFSNYLKEHPDALQEWQSVHAFLEEPIPEPSTQMDAMFYAFLEAENTEKPDTKVRSLNEPKNGSPIKLWLPLIAASVMLLFGFYMGKQWNTPSSTTNIASTEMEKSKEETNEVRTQLVMSLADQSSASKRLQALSEASKLDNATEQVIIALFKMLNSDSNVNVRLAAITSLSKYIENPKVREGLVMSITQQDSPLVQIALADLMVTLQEEKSINSMEELLRQPDINAAVKLKLEESINQII